MMQKATLMKKAIIFPIILIVLSLGAITFAWFTLAPKARVEKFTAEIRANSGIEISLDGVSFYSFIKNADIVSQVKNNLQVGTGEITLDAVTTVNGYSAFKLLDFTTHPGIPVLSDVPEVSAENPGKWVWFYLYFRTPEPGVWVYLTDDTYVTSDGWRWYTDVEYNDAAGFGSIVPGKPKMIYAANCLRMSFLTCELDTDKIGSIHPVSGDFKSVVIYELDPTYAVQPNPRDVNQRLDDHLKPYGSIDYFRAKTGSASGIDLFEHFTDAVLPEGILNNEHLVSVTDLEGDLTNKAAIVQLDAYHEESGYYYGAVKAQMWIEGWDPDCYNAILKDQLQVSLKFTSTTQAPGIAPVEIDTETEYEIVYFYDHTLGTMTHANPTVVKAHELPYFLLPAALNGHTFQGWYWDEGYAQACLFIPRDPEYVISGGKKVIRLYAKFAG
jgi:hypothetical protein